MWPTPQRAKRRQGSDPCGPVSPRSGCTHAPRATTRSHLVSPLGSGGQDPSGVVRAAAAATFAPLAHDRRVSRPPVMVCPGAGSRADRRRSAPGPGALGAWLGERAGIVAAAVGCSTRRCWAGCAPPASSSGRRDATCAAPRGPAVSTADQGGRGVTAAGGNLGGRGLQIPACNTGCTRTRATRFPSLRPGVPAWKGGLTGGQITAVILTSVSAIALTDRENSAKFSA